MKKQSKQLETSGFGYWFGRLSLPHFGCLAADYLQLLPAVYNKMLDFGQAFFVVQRKPPARPVVMILLRI